MSDFKFNAFQIKRQAHAVSRSDAGFNPFGHIWNSKNRRQTWDGEAQRDINVDDEDIETGSPIEHSQTAPSGTYGAFGHGTDARTSKDNEASLARQEQEHERERPDSSGDTVVASQAPGSDFTAVDTGAQMRNRGRLEKEPVDSPSTQPADEPKKKKEHRLFKHVQPKEPFTVGNQIQRTLLNSWINVLLVAAPVGIVLGAIPNMNPIAIFVVNFIAIIPLAALLGFATEEIALRTDTNQGRNAVELIVAIMALVKGEVVIVQTSLIGSILSNLLLVMGMCFFFGGLRRQEQFFNMTVAQTAASLLALAIAGIIIPTVFDKETELPVSSTAALSRGTAVILLFVYAGYLYFQLKTHHSVFSEESQKVPMKPKKHDLGPAAIKKGLIGPAGLVGMPGHNDESGTNNKKLQQMLNADPTIDDDEEDAEDPQLSFAVAMGTLAGSTVLIAFCAEFLVDSIDYVTTQGGISEEFLGLILLPIVGNAAEHATAVTVAIKDKMDLAIGVAVGSSMQVALFLIPLLVIIGWGMGVEDMNLSFDVFQVAVLFVSVLLVNYLIGDGKSHWLEGMLLMCLYVIIAVCSWYYPAHEAA
ncbi:Ca2+ H+ antiporter [Diaporthe amygdali]|uniref:Ca2+ H+ antiporter n=1 Tax=Phomopsis amygdali TaxID=1214568 RepID=UPI0022FEC50D|nr:Ca2+ H+ antiporter [Diaporthe amygdali]KAJ0118043.1 Ca2+ H+ antiporter [Diaporthe amygdali]